MKNENTSSQKVASSKDAKKVDAKPRDNDQQKFESKQRNGSSSSAGVKSSKRNPITFSSSDDENDFRSTEELNRKTRDAKSSSPEEISTRNSQGKKVAAKRNRISSPSSSSSDGEIFGRKTSKDTVARYNNDQLKVQAISKRRLMRVKVKKLNVPSMEKCTGAKLSRGNKIQSWMYKRSDSVSSKSEGKSSQLSSSSTASKNSSSSKSGNSSRDRHPSLTNEKRQDSASSLFDQILHSKSKASVPIQSSSEPSSKRDSDATASGFKPYQRQDSAASLSGTNQHDQSPQVNSSNSQTSAGFKSPQQSADSPAPMSNQVYSNLPLTGEKRRQSFSSNEGADKSDDSVSILDDNFEKTEKVLSLGGRKRQKVEVKKEAISQADDPDADFYFEVKYCWGLNSGVLKLDTSIETGFYFLEFKIW